jgi:hypothetical protein
LNAEVGAGAAFGFLEDDGAYDMHEVLCESCGLPAPPYDIVNYGSTEGGYRKLCGRCFNADVAKRAGVEGFEYLRFEPIVMTDASGKAHDFHFRTHLFGSGVAIDALELRDGNPIGYEFRVVGDPAEDLLALLGRLIEKMRRALAKKHVEDTEHGLQVTDDLVVRGQIGSEVDADDQVPLVIVDGREISWRDFGRMLMAFEGWQFKMEMRDLSDES